MSILAFLGNSLDLLATAREIRRIVAPGAAPSPEQIAAIRGILGLPGAVEATAA